MTGMQRPKVGEASPDVLTRDELRRLLDAAKSTSFEDRRDTAIVRQSHPGR